MSNPIALPRTAPSPTAYPPRGKREIWRDWLFERVHGNKLVYNTCWEDPRCDRAMLELDANSEVVMITSAGDNALAYLLDGPRRIHAIDVNPRQNALLELKMAGLRELDHATFFELFGTGRSERITKLYYYLRPGLSDSAQVFWDGHLHYFHPRGVRRGLYHHGSSGCFGWLASRFMQLDGKLRKEVRDLLDTTDLERQKALYYVLEPRLLKRILGGKTRQRVALSLVGVPAAQRQLIEAEAGGLEAYIRRAFRHIFAELPVHDNYFYPLYLNGQYTPERCPDYLNAANFTPLNRRLDRLQTHTTTVADFLVNNPGQYSHFVLLDHQDWLYANAPAALHDEWEQVLANSRPGTRILLRSAYARPETVPDFVRRRCRFRNDLSAPQAALDRVGTYAGCFLLEVVG